MLIKKRCNRQMGSFALTTIAWIICCMAMGLPQWRVWRFHDPVVSRPTTAFVGMWRVCTLQRDNSFRSIRVCHRYSYQDTFIPLDIRVVQQLLLVSSFLGLVGKITIIISFWNVCMGRVQKNGPYNPFCFSGILNVVASSLLCLAVLFNYVSIVLKQEIAFPPSFNIPSDPDTQDIGSAMALALIAATFFLLSGTILLSSKFSTCKPKPARYKT